MPAEKVVTEQRRGSKPLVEKKRRARINRSLAELQALVVDTRKKQGCKHSRVEKADILEMTVRYLQSLQKEQKEEYYQCHYSKFRAGYMECVEEVCRFFTTIKYKDSATLQEKMSEHLMGRLPRVQSKNESFEKTQRDADHHLLDDDDEEIENEDPKRKKTKKEIAILRTETESEEVSTTTTTTTIDSSSRSTTPSPQPSSSYSPLPTQLPATAGTTATVETSTAYAQTLPVIPSCLPNGQLALLVPTKEYLQYVTKSLMVTQDGTLTTTVIARPTSSQQMSDHDRIPAHNHRAGPCQLTPPPLPSDGGHPVFSHGSHETALNLCMTPQQIGATTDRNAEKLVLPQLGYSHMGQMWRPW